MARPCAIRSSTSAKRSVQLLAPHVTNLDRPVFALVNLPETVKGALFARYSRYPGTLRRLYLEEFAAEVPEGGRPFEGEEGERAAGLYERVFLGYGDDSIAQVGGAHLACEWVSNILTKLLQRGRLAAYLEQSTRYIPYDTPMPEAAGGGYRYYRDEQLGPEYAAAMDELFGIYSSSLETVTAVGGRALAARRRRARAGLAELDPGKGARPAARPAARGDAEPRRHLRLGPGLRAAAAADDGLAAARGARLRDDDPGGAEEGDAELRLTGRAPGPRWRVDRLPRGAPRGDRALGQPPRAGRAACRRTPRRSSWSRSGRRGGAAGRLAVRVRRGARPPDPGPGAGASPRRAGGRDRRAGGRARRTAATAQAAAGRRSATASRSSPTTAASATCSATAC